MDGTWLWRLLVNMKREFLHFSQYDENFSEQSSKVICLELVAVYHLSEGIIISSLCQEHMESLLIR